MTDHILRYDSLLKLIIEGDTGIETGRPRSKYITNISKDVALIRYLYPL